MRDLLQVSLMLALLVALLWYLRHRQKELHAASWRSPTPWDMGAGANKRLAGVRGWLLFFCVVLVFLYPIYLLWLNRQTMNLGRVLGESTRIHGIMLLLSVVNIAVLIGSITAGIRLWRRRPKAVQSARVMIVVAWLQTLLNGALPLAANLPTEVSRILLRHLAWGILKSSVYCALFWLYLARSKRVAATFRNAPETK